MVNIDNSKFVVDDGGLGNSKAKNLNPTKDCVTRALAIATGKPYDHILDRIMSAGAADRARIAKANPNEPPMEPLDPLNKGVEDCIALPVAEELGMVSLWDCGIITKPHAALRHFLFPKADLIAAIAVTKIIIPDFLTRHDPHWVAIKSGRVHDVEKFCKQGEKVLNIGVIRILGRKEVAASKIKEIAENPDNLPESEQAPGVVP